MRISALLRTATLALSLTAAMGAMTATFAQAASAPQLQQWNQQSNTGPYDSPDFVVPRAEIFS